MKSQFMKKIIAMGLSTTMAGALLTGCGSSSSGTAATDTSAEKSEADAEESADTSSDRSEETSIKYWYWADNTEYSEVMQKIVTKFNETNDRGITVIAEEYPYDDGGYMQNMMTAVLGGGGPDCACFKLDSVPLYDANSLLYDMKEFVNSWDGKSDVDDGIWNVVNEVSGDGKVSVIPFAVDIPYCYYRPSMFEKANLEVPTTFDEFEECIKALTQDTDGDGKTDVYGYGLRGVGGQAIWASFAYACGGGMDSLTSEGSIRAMKDCVDLYQGGYFPATAPTDGFTEISANFKSGVTAMTVHHIGSSQDMINTFGDDVSAFIVPSNVPEDTWVQLGDTSNVIMSTSENPEAAFEWIKYLTTGEGQYMWNTEVGKIPVATSLRRDEAFSNDFYQVSFEGLKYAGVLPSLDTLDEYVSDAFPNNFQAALLKQETAEEACQALQNCLYGK